MRFFEKKWPAVLLWPFSLIYRGITVTRNASYDHGLLRISCLPCPVISIGNITVGGTGKTPTVLFWAQWLQRRNIRPAILSRGYRRKETRPLIVADGEEIFVSAEQGGDEPLLLARRLPGVPVVVDRDRVRGGRLVCKNFAPDVILLDDGFQHRRLHRDLDVVTFKFSQSIGNGYLLPAGPLRESASQLRRAHLFWLNGGEAKNSPFLDRYASVPRLTARYRAKALIDRQGQEANPLKAGRRIVAFCGLANPFSFLDSLQQQKLTVAQFITFPDHYYYSAADLETIGTAAAHNGADLIVTTEKDWVKLVDRFPLDERWHFLPLHLEPIDAEGADRILAGLLGGIGVL